MIKSTCNTVMYMIIHSHINLTCLHEHRMYQIKVIRHNHSQFVSKSFLKLAIKKTEMFMLVHIFDQILSVTDYCHFSLFECYLHYQVACYSHTSLSLLYFCGMEKVSLIRQVLLREKMFIKLV